MNPAGATIMLVDGQTAGLQTLSSGLEGAGHTLVTVADGLSAWGLLTTDPGRYDVVVLDDESRGLNGMQLLDRMQRHPILHGVPVILQTGSVEHPVTREVGSSGSLSCLDKPFDPAQLLGALAMALGNRVSYRSSPQGRDPAGGEVPCVQHEATFTFKTPHSARDLATLLANTCPEPQRVVVGLAELLLNAVEHGNLHISYEEKSRLRAEERWEEEVTARLADPEYANKEVWVEYVREPDRVRILIRDQGAGFDWQRYLAMTPADSAGLHGRGIAIARAVSFDNIEYRGCGNEVEVTVDT